MSYIDMYEVSPPGTPATSQQKLWVDSTTKSLVKMDANGNKLFLGGAAVPNVVLVGKSLGAGTTVTASIASGVATIAHTAHGYATGDYVNMAGNSSGSPGDFNQLHQITVTDANHYTFSTTGTAVAGTIYEMLWFSGTRSLNATLIKNVVRNATGSFEVFFLNTQTDTFFGFGGTSGAPGQNVLVGINESSYGGGHAPTTTSLVFGTTNPGGTSYDPTSYLMLEFSGLS